MVAVVAQDRDEAAPGKDCQHRQGWKRATHDLHVSEAPPALPLGDAVLTGEIVNAINKEPVAGATVRILGTKLSAKTDSRGRFKIPGAPTATVPVEVSPSVPVPVPVAPVPPPVADGPVVAPSVPVDASCPVALCPA